MSTEHHKKAASSTASAPSSAEAPLSMPAAPAQRRAAGTVSRSTCLLLVCLALFCGLLLGNLMPYILGDTVSLLRGCSSRPVPPVGQSSFPAVTPAPPAPAAPAAADSGGTADAMLTPEQKHIAHLEQAVAAGSGTEAAWVALGNAYFDTHQPAKAIHAYTRALAINPANANVFTDLGIMYRENGQLQEALNSFAKAIQYDPRHEHARFNMGVVLLFDLKRNNEAKKVWQELLQLNPGATAPDGQPLANLIRQCDAPAF